MTVKERRGMFYNGTPEGKAKKSKCSKYCMVYIVIVVLALATSVILTSYFEISWSVPLPNVVDDTDATQSGATTNPGSQSNWSNITETFTSA